ncbi:MAG: HypC/HybG/HupF family hydrogenase formation chaperone [Acidimicrobiia bacterium]
MCLGVPGRVVELFGEHDARVDLDGTVRDVSLAVLTLDGRGVGPGDWVMCHTGFAVEVVDPAEAESIVALRHSMRQAAEVTTTGEGS